MPSTLDEPQHAPTTFAELAVPAPIVAVLDHLGCPAPFAIQAAALPDALAGHHVLAGPADWRTSCVKVTSASMLSRSPPSTRQTTWPPSGSCLLCAACWTRPAPSDGQRLLFSATVDGDGDGDVLVRRYLRDPRVHAVDEPSNSVPAMTHRLVTVRAQHKRAVVHELLSGPERTLAFARTKHGARTLARRLSEAGIPSLDLHGNLSQAARTRNLDAYLHRSGCTARAGSTGTVVTIATPEQRSAVRNLVRPAAHREGDSHRRKPRDRGVHHGIEPARLRAAVCGAPVRVDQGRPASPPRRRGRSRR